MKTVKEKIKDSYALPGKPMTQAEFEAHIKEAEKGPFVTLEEGNREFEAWKKTRKKIVRSYIFKQKCRETYNYGAEYEYLIV